MGDVLFWGLKASPVARRSFTEACGQVNCNFWSKKDLKKFQLYFFFLTFWSSKPWIQIHIRIPLKRWVRIRIQIRIQWIRIHNSEWKVALIRCFQSRSCFHLQKTKRNISQRYVALIFLSNMMQCGLWRFKQLCAIFQIQFDPFGFGLAFWVQSVSLKIWILPHYQ